MLVYGCAWVWSGAHVDQGGVPVALAVASLQQQNSSSDT